MIGERNQRASLLAKTMTPDGGGGFSESWNVIASLWVKLEAQSGGNAFGPDAAEATMRYRVTLRRNADVAVGMRLGIGARDFAIRNILDEGANAPDMILLVEDVP